MNKIPPSQWIAWMMATCAAAFTMMSYAQANYMTLREKADIVSWLERIDAKIDKISEDLRDSRRNR